VAESANDFFQDIEARLSSQLGADKQALIKTVLADVRLEYSGTQLYINRYTSRPDHIAHICNKWLAVKREFAEKHGISVSTLDKYLKSKAHRTKPISKAD